MIVRTIRGNGVNTPVIIFDERNEQHLPLLVQYRGSIRAFTEDGLLHLDPSGNRYTRGCRGRTRST